MLQLPEAVQTVSDNIVKISQVDMCVDTFSALIQHFLYAILFGRYCIMRSAKKGLYKQALFCGKMKSLAVGQKVVNKIAEKLRGKLSLWHCNYLPIREKGIGEIKICNLMMTFFHYPPQTIISHKTSAVVPCEKL